MDDRHMFEAAGGGFRQHARHLRRVAFGHDDGVDAEGRRRTQNRADIMRIGDLVEHENDAARRSRCRRDRAAPTAALRASPPDARRPRQGARQRLGLDDMRDEGPQSAISVAELLRGGLRRENDRADCVCCRAKLRARRESHRARRVLAPGGGTRGRWRRRRAALSGCRGGAARARPADEAPRSGSAPDFGLGRRGGLRCVCGPNLPLDADFAIASHAGLSGRMRDRATVLSWPLIRAQSDLRDAIAGARRFRLTAAGPVRISAFTKVLTTGPLGECPERQRGRTVNPLATPS